MALYIFDTDHVSLFQRGQPAIASRVIEVSGHDLAVTIITYQEQLRGRLTIIHRLSDPSDLSTAYLRMHEMQKFYCALHILDFNPVAAVIFEKLRPTTRRIGTLDLRIASIVLAYGGVLVTRNTRDFAAIPDLRLEDWSRA
jgi:tRNA(fMet)-specific endonuclease VapC